MVNVVSTRVAPADAAAIREAAQLIRAGGLVAFPTETVYGLGANAFDPRALARIFEAKQRPLNDPLIVHLPANLRALEDWQQMGLVGTLSDVQADRARRLIAQFAPGPITLVLPRGARAPALLSAGLDTVAVRIPNHPVAQALLREASVPIAAPSANRFGHVSPTTAQHVLDDLGGRIPLVLDGGATQIGVESTVVNLCVDPPCILRPGGVSRERIAQALGVIVSMRNIALSEAEAAPAPGMLARHYAPHVPLILCANTSDLLRRHAQLQAQGRRVGALLRDQERPACAHIHPHYLLGETLEHMAQRLYAGLRALESVGVDAILVCLPDDGSELSEAIADRLRRAAA